MDPDCRLGDEELKTISVVSLTGIQPVEHFKSDQNSRSVPEDLECGTVNNEKC